MIVQRRNNLQIRLLLFYYQLQIICIDSCTKTDQNIQ